jgi:hypothetical protein
MKNKNIKKNKKINRTAALSLLTAVLLSCFAGFSIVAVPVQSWDYAAGSVASFELRDELTGRNVMGTVLNRSATLDVASYHNPNICTRLSFSSVRVFIDGGSTVEWATHYWRAHSLNPDVAEVTGERKADGNRNYFAGDIYSGDYFLRIDVLTEGTTVVNVEVSASPDMKGSITRTFTVRVIDDSGDGEVRASFHRGMTGGAVDLNREVRINMTETAELLISSVTGLNYSNLNAANFERSLNSYSWSAEIMNRTGSAAVSSSPEGVYSRRASGSVDEGSGGRVLYIRPLSEGTVDIEFTLTPGEIHDARYRTSVQTVRLFISRVVGSLEFVPVFEIYGENTQPEDVRIRLEDFQVMINGENRTVAELVNEGSASLTAYITAPKGKMTAQEYDEENSLWETNPANMDEARMSFDINGGFLRDPAVSVPLTESARVRIEIEGRIFNEYKSASRWADIRFVTEEYNGRIASLSFMSGGEPVYSGKTLEASVDRYGNAEKIIVLDGFEVEVFDSRSPEAGYKRPLESDLYIIDARMNLPIAGIEIDGNAGTMTITPRRTGTTEITVRAEMLDGSSSIEFKFFVTSLNIGLRPEDEGIILAVELKRDDTDQRIYTGNDRIIYLENGNGNALTVNIDRVTATANNPESDYTGELKDFRWDIFQSYPGNPANRLSIDNIQGSTADGKADIKIGTDAITGETGKITVRLRITPRVRTLDENGTEIYRYETDKSFEVFFGIIVNGLGAKFALEIDYANERIFIVTSRVGKDKGYYNFAGAPEYMYALRAVEDGADQSREEWIPFMGSSMDISSLIPVRGTAPFRIAVREIDSLPGDDGDYLEEDRKIIELPPRRSVSSAERRAVVYREGRIVYNGLESGTESIFYSVGLSDFTRGEMNANLGIDVPGISNPLGNTVTIKFAAYIDFLNGENNRFASAEFRVRVPGTGRLPVIRDDGRRKYSGFTDRMLWSAGGNDDGWQSCSRGAVRYENLEFAFPGLRKDESGNFYNLYLKTAATPRTPESNMVILKIPADRYER